MTLYVKNQTGVDGFNHPVEELTPVKVDNVLIAPATTQEVLDSVSLYGRRAEYVLAIPKTDDHEWENQIVEFWGHKWNVICISVCGIDELVPGAWNKKVQVERFG